MEVAINGLRIEMQTITDEGKTTFAEAQDHIRTHHSELYANANRV